jgi:hypothetical protein
MIALCLRCSPFLPYIAEGRKSDKKAFGRKPLNFRIPSGLAAILEQPCHRGVFATMSLNRMAERLNIGAAGSAAKLRHTGERKREYALMPD